MKGERTDSAPSHAPVSARKRVKRSTGESPGQPLSSEIITLCVPTLSCQGEGHTSSQRNQDRELIGDATESQTLRMDRHSPRGNRETPETPLPVGGRGRLGKVADRTPNMYVNGESDDPIVPGKQANKVGPKPAAESVEGGDRPRGTLPNRPRTGHRAGIPRRPVLVAYGQHPVGNSYSDQCFHVIHPRQEPYEVVPHVRIRAGGGPKGPSLPR